LPVSEHVIICECFARDGLQHETTFIATERKVALIDAFSRAGFRRIEATSYSHPDHVPAFRDASQVLAGINRSAGVWYKATCPNAAAVTRALADLATGHGAGEISLLASATESHTQRNLRTTRDGQWRRIEEMVALANGRFRLVGVVSAALGCPFEGEVDPESVAADVRRSTKRHPMSQPSPIFTIRVVPRSPIAWRPMTKAAGISIPPWAASAAIRRRSAMATATPVMSRRKTW
jgi:hydroxymethylglutaryl-CoA lyase